MDSDFTEISDGSSPQKKARETKAARHKKEDGEVHGSNLLCMSFSHVTHGGQTKKLDSMTPEQKWASVLTEAKKVAKLCSNAKTERDRHLCN